MLIKRGDVALHCLLSIHVARGVAGEVSVAWYRQESVSSSARYRRNSAHLPSRGMGVDAACGGGGDDAYNRIISES